MSFVPDYTNMVKVARNQWVDRVPLYEHGVGAKIIYELTGTKPYELMFSKDMKESVEGFRQFWEFWKMMGYDTSSYEFQIIGALVGGGALGQHKEGCIKNRADFERYPWDEVYEKYFELYVPYIENYAKTCPDGMKAVGCVGNGVFECVQDIIGYENLCFLKADDEELFFDVFKKMGELQYRVWDRFMDEYDDVFCVLRFGDDLGFKSSTLLSHDDIVSCIVPQYKKIIEKVHSRNKPFLLHSCGCIFDVMCELINDAKIDAKHSNEDIIAHFTTWVDKYGDKIGNFGGIDTDVLCSKSPNEITEYVVDCLEKVKGKGGIAFGSGNSIPDYVPLEGFLAMNSAVRKWRGEQ